jgi:Egh16-like virulence factor
VCLPANLKGITSAVGGLRPNALLVNTVLARNCTDISPCQQDSTLIRDSEIQMNIVNGCGRTELTGNIDIGEQTENELAAKRVAQVNKGSVLAVTIHQVDFVAL